METVECRVVIRFLYLRGRTPKETFDEMKDIYGEDAPSYDVVKHWHRQFKCGRTLVETAPILGGPQSSIHEDTIQQVEFTILEDRRITVRQLAQDVKINCGKQERVQSSQALLTMCQENQEEFFDRLITQDETWVHHYDPETKAQSKQWRHYDSPSPKKARVQPSAAKKLREAIKSERRGMLTKGVRLLQDNAPVHNAHVAQTKARSCGYEILPHLPYPPDLAPSDFHLFPVMKVFLKGKLFSDDEMLISEVKS
ncbi:histone-lysine N-methyltransferase SETMAR-like [Scylla paramamosain]|uniref:histone-lysine N-methyltransferase SETMAR-like n=1 Tax=Scylla paramamosain TaxID=85552 RepID=UPI0030827AB2